MHMCVCFHFIIFITAAFFHLYISHPLKFNFRNCWFYLHLKIYISVADWWSFQSANGLISPPAALCQKAISIITGKNLEWVTHKERKWPLDLPNSRLAPPTPFTQKPKAGFSGADPVHFITVAVSYHFSWNQTFDPWRCRTVSNLRLLQNRYCPCGIPSVAAQFCTNRDKYTLITNWLKCSHSQTQLWQHLHQTDNLIQTLK